MGIKENILGADDLRRTEIQEWGEVFYIRELSANEVEKIQSYEVGTVKRIASFIIAGAVDADGKQLFQWQEINKLCERNFKTLSSVAAQVVDFNGLSEGAAEELEGN